MRSFNSLYKGLALGLSLFALSLGNVYCGSSSGGSSGGGGNGGNKTTLEVSIDNDSYLRGEQVCVNGTASGTKDFGWAPNPEVGFKGLTGTLNGCFPLSYDSPLARQDLVAYAGSLERSVSFMPLNNPPVADAGTDQGVPSRTDVTLPYPSTVPGNDIDGNVTLYEWDIDGDGEYDWSSTTTGSILVGYTDGNHTAKLRVTDNDGDTDTDTVDICVGPGC